MVEGDYRNGVEFCQTGKTEAYGEELGKKNAPRCARGWVALKRSPYNIAPPRRTENCYQLCMVPSSLRLTGKYARLYGYVEASCSSISTPRPGVSPGCIMPSAKM